MARRKKSIEDITAQVERIERLGRELSARDGKMDLYAAARGDYKKEWNKSERRSTSRVSRANSIAYQYIDNIKSTDYVKRLQSQLANATTDEKKEAIRERHLNHQYSPSTYRGLSFT